MSQSNKEQLLEKLQESGVHFAYSKSKRHPSTVEFILGKKDVREIFNLEKVAEKLEEAKEVLQKALKAGETVLFVGTKNEAKSVVKNVAESLSMPYVNIRFIGGTLTNFSEIKKRIARMLELREKFSAGELKGYTKKEKVMLERELAKLEEKFSGIAGMQNLPSLLILVDPKHESIALKEAKMKGIKVLAIANNDCDYSALDHFIPANDASYKSIKFLLEYISEKN